MDQRDRTPAHPFRTVHVLVCRWLSEVPAALALHFFSFISHDWALLCQSLMAILRGQLWHHERSPDQCRLHHYPVRPASVPRCLLRMPGVLGCHCLLVLRSVWQPRCPPAESIVCCEHRVSQAEFCALGAIDSRTLSCLLCFLFIHLLPGKVSRVHSPVSIFCTSICLDGCKLDVDVNCAFWHFHVSVGSSRFGLITLGAESFEIKLCISCVLGFMLGQFFILTRQCQGHDKVQHMLAATLAILSLLCYSIDEESKQHLVRDMLSTGSPPSLSGLVRLSSPMFVRDSMCIAPSAQLHLPVWTISWDTGTSELQFKTGSTKDGLSCEVMAVSASGGSLHGTWASESIISASDSHLKREVLPLYRSLLEKREQSAGEGAGGEERQDISASSLLRLLVPDGLDSRSSDPLNLKLEATDESLRSLPGVVRQMPNQGGRLGISHQDLLAARDREMRICLGSVGYLGSSCRLPFSGAREAPGGLGGTGGGRDCPTRRAERSDPGALQPSGTAYKAVYIAEVPRQQKTNEISIHVKGGTEPQSIQLRHRPVVKELSAFR
eukprot:s397_g38.t1